MGRSVATIRNTTFRNMQRRQELVDVSFGGTAVFENTRLVNISLGEGTAVASTTSNDYEYNDEFSFTYYSDDDATHYRDVPHLPVWHWQDGALRPSESEFLITDGPLSDCLYQGVPFNAVMPGCAPETVQQRAGLLGLGSDDMSSYIDAVFDDPDPEARFRRLLLQPDSPASWLAATRKVITAL